MSFLVPPLDDPAAEAAQLALEQAIAVAEQRGRELLLRAEQERELVAVGDPETWP